MAGKKHGRIVPARPSKGTERANRHKFRGFQERVATLKINPLQKTRLSEEKEISSHFAAKLEHWKEANLSEPFFLFSREISPLCDSLTQLIHHEQKIVDILVVHLQQRDPLYLEPLLDLTSQLARDLGYRFEKHYQRTITSISQIISSTQEVEVLEWSFDTLAWLFHYLSRLLVPDLRPTFDILAPLLGREIQKGHLARFAAEAFSFLLRKAAIRIERDPTSLQLAASYALDDWIQCKDDVKDREVYAYGLMNLFSDCCKDLRSSHAIRPYGNGVFEILLKESLLRKDITIVQGVLVNIIHHTNTESFESILNVIVKEASQCDQNRSIERILQLCRLLDTVIETRGGIRIEDWSSVFEAFSNLLKLASVHQTEFQSPSIDFTRIAASLIQFASFDCLVSFLNKAMKELMKSPGVIDLSLFFLFAWDLNHQRFSQLLRPFFFDFLARRWDHDELKILFVLQTLSLEDSEAISTFNSSRTGWKSPMNQAIGIIKDWHKCENEDYWINALLSFTATDLRDAGSCKSLEVALTDSIGAFLETSTTLNRSKRRLPFGAGLKYYLACISVNNTVSAFDWHQLSALQDDIGRMPLYIENLDQAFGLCPKQLSSFSSIQPLLTSNLATGNSRLRLASLKLLCKIYQQAELKEADALLSAIQIEQSAFDYTSVRSISMHIRRIAESYSSTTNHTWLFEAIVYYLFGLLTIDLTPIWKDAIESLRGIYDSSEAKGPALVEDLVFRWLESKQDEPADSKAPEDVTNGSSRMTEFQCTKFDVQTQQLTQRTDELKNVKQRMEKRFEEDHTLVQAVPIDSSSLALRILASIPTLAEKRSRRLVPMFLSWSSAEEDSEATAQGDDPINLTERFAANYSDRKALLEIFGSISNPKALYRSNDVYAALLRQLENGDTLVQKAALRAIMTWKKPELRLFEENFNNLLDKARFREELTMFLPDNFDEKGLMLSQRDEVMQVLLPLLFGRVTARGKSTASKMTQKERRKAVFESLGSFPIEDALRFLGIALGPLKSVTLNGVSPVLEEPDSPTVPPRRQLGFIRLAQDMLESIGNKLAPITNSLMPPLIYCISAANPSPHVSEAEMIDLDTNQSISKSIRKYGIQCLITMFNLFPKDCLSPYISAVFSSVIEPRLGEKFQAENAQSVSSILQLLSAWASSDHLKDNFALFDGILPQIVNCLDSKGEANAAPVKQDVKRYIIDNILQQLLSAQYREEVCISASTLNDILLHSASILQKERTAEMTTSITSLILQLAPKVTSSQALRLTSVLSTMLQMSNREVSPVSKTKILAVFEQCVSSIPSSSSQLQDLFEGLSKQFAVLKSEPRQQLSRTFVQLGHRLGGNFETIADLCADINSFSTTALDEPDLERRSSAFEKIFSEDFQASEIEWNPIVQNSLFYIQDQEETFIRKNASQALRRFVSNFDNMTSNGEQTYPDSKILRGSIFSALRRGASESSELVRAEYISLMEHLIKTLPLWTEITDMTTLTEYVDDGESVFGGIIHIQQEWRKRALVKLARIARQGHLKSGNISHYLIPLCENFVLERGDNPDAHPLAAQAMTTIGSLCQGLEWPQARKILRRYVGLIKEKPDIEKALIRLVDIITGVMHTACASSDFSGNLATTVPAQDSLSGDVCDVLLPPLTAFLHHKDENVVSLRVPMAVSAVRLICLLPQQALEHKLATVLTDVCNILRSKSQESRDLSRKTLAEIAALIGPSRFSFILKELRIALSRGYQLHVKSYTLHSLLVASDFRSGDLDYCLNEIMKILLDDIFGAVGQEKDADGYTNKAKEVKGAKSMDSAERIAKIVTAPHFREIVNPVRTLLTERLDSRALNRSDELLRRIANGMQQNSTIGSQDTLVFCYQLLENVKSLATSLKANQNVLSIEERQRIERFEINSTSARKAPILPQVSTQQFKLARFSLDLLRAVLHQYDSLRIPANLHGFLSPVGDILIDAQEEVQISALRFLASIAKVPMKDWESSGPVYANTAFKIIKSQPDTNTELSQAALKLVTSLMRECSSVKVKDSQVAALIKATLPDLTHPSRQGVTFNFLKAVVSRKIVNNDIYEAMDAIARLFVTYGDGNARNQARSIWLQFLINYEQNERRFDQQLSFLTKNLTFKYTEGRESVMEAIHFLLGKLDLPHQQKAGLVLFLPLIDRMVSDEAVKCQEMAELLLGEVFRLATDENFLTFHKILERLYSQAEDVRNKTTALQVSRIAIANDKVRMVKNVPLLSSWIYEIISEAADRHDSSWELAYAALKLGAALCSHFENETLGPTKSELWKAVLKTSSYPHAWVKSASANLVGIFLRQFDPSKGAASGSEVLQSRTGLSLSLAEIEELAHRYLNSFWHDPPIWLASILIENLDTIERIAGQREIKENSTIDYTWDIDHESSEGEDIYETDKTNAVSQVYFRRLSMLLRHSSPSLGAKTALIQFLARLVNRLPPQTLIKSIRSILTPILHFADASISRATEPSEAAQQQRQRLTDVSHEIMIDLQKRLPESHFINEMHNIQQDMKTKRNERRAKRRIDAVADPEKFSEMKMRKRDRGRERKKEKNQIQRSKRRGW